MHNTVYSWMVFTLNALHIDPRCGMKSFWQVLAIICDFPTKILGGLNFFFEGWVVKLFVVGATGRQ